MCSGWYLLLDTSEIIKLYGYKYKTCLLYYDRVKTFLVQLCSTSATFYYYCACVLVWCGAAVPWNLKSGCLITNTVTLCTLQTRALLLLTYSYKSQAWEGVLSAETENKITSWLTFLLLIGLFSWLENSASFCIFSRSDHSPEHNTAWHVSITGV